jgi:hypothetical protein
MAKTNISDENCTLKIIKIKAEKCSRAITPERRT